MKHLGETNGGTSRLLSGTILAICGLVCTCALIPCLTQADYKLLEMTADFIEGCSCSVECPCNVGRPPSPDPICRSVAALEINSHSVSALDLLGKRLAIENVSGDRGIVIVDDRAGLMERDQLAKIGEMILAHDGTGHHSHLLGQIEMHSTDLLFAAHVKGHCEVRGRLLMGANGKKRHKLLNPMIFGDLPVSYAYKGVAESLVSIDLGFEYHGRNANTGSVDLRSAYASLAWDRPTTLAYATPSCRPLTALTPK